MPTQLIIRLNIDNHLNTKGKSHSVQQAKINYTHTRVRDTNEILTYLIKELKQMAGNRKLGDDRHVNSRYAIEETYKA